MAESFVRVKNVGKHYLIHQKSSYSTSLILTGTQVSQLELGSTQLKFALSHSSYQFHSICIALVHHVIELAYSDSYGISVAIIKTIIIKTPAVLLNLTCDRALTLKKIY